jgi:hypothetical protein
MAAVVVFGLVVSARNPRPTIAAADRPAKVAAKPPDRAPRPADSASITHVSRTPISSKPISSAARVDAKHSTAVIATLKPAPPALRESSSPATVVETPRLADKPIEKPATTTTPAAAIRTPTQPVARPTVAKPEAAKPDAAKSAAFAAAVAAARVSMSKRNLTASKQRLQAATTNAQTDAEQAELDRLEILQDHLEQYWAGISKAVAAMQPVDEIVLTNSNRVAVIEASRTNLVVQWEGRRQNFRINAIPRELLWAITKTSFKPTAGSKLVVGAFLAMDEEGNRAQAARLWKEALQAGEEEGKSLLPELEVPRARK